LTNDLYTLQLSSFEGGDLAIAKANSPAEYFGASIRVWEGYGEKGAKPRPWHYEAAMRQYVGWCYAAAMIRASAMATVPLRAYTRRRPGRKLYKTRPVTIQARRYLYGEAEHGKQPSDRAMRKAIEFAGDLEEVIEPLPILRLLQTVNPWQNGTELTILRSLDQQITGNHYTHVVNDPVLGTPAQLWRMPPQWVRIIPSRTEFVGGYLYGKGMDIEKTFAEDEVDHYRWPNPRDIHYGMGWVEAAWTALGLYSSKRNEDTAVHDNMSRPDWLLSIPNATADILKSVKQDVEERLRGTDKRGSFLAINKAVTATALNQREGEDGTPTRLIEEISADSRVPVAMLLSNDPTKASSATARLGFYRETVQGDCRLDSEKLNERLVPRYPDSDEVFLEYDPAAFEDREAQTKRVVALRSGGIISVNEARQEEGYGPAVGGDVIHSPAGTSGGAAAVAGNLSPFQNDDRHNEDEIRGEKSNTPTVVSATVGVGEAPDDGTDQLKAEADAYGVAVRAGVITPQLSDEEHFREKLSLPPMSDDAKRAWKDDKGARRPITLTPPGGEEPKPVGGLPKPEAEAEAEE